MERGWRLILVLLFLIPNISYSASQFTHYFFGKVFAAHALRHNNEAFLYGNIFPDIRYLGSIPRNSTHFKKLQLSDIKNTSSSFVAGMKLHSFVDEKREQFAKKHGVYNLIRKYETVYDVTLLKLLEDQYFWNVEMAKSALNMIDHYPFKKIDFAKIDEKTFIKWNAWLHIYFSKPLSENISEYSKIKGKIFIVPNDVMKEWDGFFSKIVETKEFKEYCEALKKHFEDLFSKI